MNCVSANLERRDAFQHLYSTHCLATPLGRGIYSYLQSEEGVADRVCLQTDEYTELRQRAWGNRGTAPMKAEFSKGKWSMT